MGLEVLTKIYTPKSTNSKLLIEVYLNVSNSGTSNSTNAALYKDSDLYALCSGQGNKYSASGLEQTHLMYVYNNRSLNTITFKVRIGEQVGTNTNINGTTARLFGGSQASVINIQEYVNDYTDFLELGYSTVFYRDTFGKLWSWGQNDYGQLGDGTITNQTTPVLVLGGIIFSSITTYSSHTLGIRGSDGIGFGWGYGSQGYLGIGDSAAYSSPTLVASNISWSQLSTSMYHSLGINGLDGTAWAWGINSIGQLGMGNATSYSSPVSVHGNISFIQISAGYNHSLGIKGLDGSAWTWGGNDNGQLGTNNTTSYSSPVSVVGGISFTQLSAGNFYSLGIRGLDGSAWAWGYNGYGQLGTNNTTQYSSPVSVVGGISFKQIDTFFYSSVGINGLNNTGYAWGLNSNGQLGTGNLTNCLSPTLIIRSVSFSDLKVGYNNIGGIGYYDNKVWLWGDNTYKQTTQKNNMTLYVNQSSPVLVTTIISFSDMFGASNYIGGIRGLDGSAWMWGTNNVGQLGDGTITSKYYPTLILGNISWKQIAIGADLRVAGTYPYFNHSLGIRGSDGSAWAWGGNNIGQLGHGNIISYSSPVSVLGGISFKQVSSNDDTSIGLRGSDGTAWAWGDNSLGNLGNNTRTSYSSPVSVVGGISWKETVLGTDHTLGIRGSDGTGWAWGYNTLGQLGIDSDRSMLSVSSPVSITGSISWKQIVAGGYHSLGISGSNGIAWSWGSNSYGQLGNVGTLTSYSSGFFSGSYYDTSIPTSVKGGISWAQLAAGSGHSLGIRGSDGTAWAWGNNSSGQLGTGNTTSYSSPTSVLGGMSFTKIYAGRDYSSGLNGLDGSIWAWGNNANYCLTFQYTPKNYMSPVKILPDL